MSLKSVTDRLRGTADKSKVFHSAQTLQQSQFVDIARIHTDPTLQAILPINEDTKTGIIESMKASGFDENFPILLIKQDNKLVVVDGHTRLAAAKECELTRVPAKIVSALSSTKESIAYIINVQMNRRNLTEADYIRILQNTDIQRFIHSQDGKYRENVAKFLNISTGKAQYLLSVIHSENEDVIDDVVAGEKSVHQAYTELNPKPIQKTTAEERPSESAVSDEIESAVESASNEDIEHGESSPEREVAKVGTTQPSTAETVPKPITAPPRQAPKEDNTNIQQDESTPARNREVDGGTIEHLTAALKEGASLLEHVSDNELNDEMRSKLENIVMLIEGVLKERL